MPQSAIFDLFLKYIWQRYEFFVVFQNLANTKWRSAEHVFTSRLQGEPAEGVLGSNFTPGDPFTAKAGVTIHCLVSQGGKTMKGLTKLLHVVLATSIWSWISTIQAHEFIIKPAALRVNAGDKVPFSVLSTHVFMSGEELLVRQHRQGIVA